jgi:hypothetical protein
MANVKKTKTEVDNLETSNVASIVVDTSSSDNSKDQEISALQKQLQEMQKVILAMQSAQYPNSQKEDSSEVLYEIGTRFVNGVTIFSPMKDVKIEMDFGKLYEIELHELNSLLKNPQNREWLEKDILFFTNSEVYKKKKLNRQYFLDDDTLTELIMSKDTDVLKSIFNKMTENMNYDPMIYCLFYRIVELAYSGKLNSMSHPTRQMIEKMFKFNLDNAEMLFQRYKEVSR